jgi:hypothetical protein
MKQIFGKIASVVFALALLVSAFATVIPTTVAHATGTLTLGTVTSDVCSAGPSTCQFSAVEFNNGILTHLKVGKVDGELWMGSVFASIGFNDTRPVGTRDYFWQVESISTGAYYDSGRPQFFEGNIPTVVAFSDASAHGNGTKSVYYTVP